MTKGKVARLPRAQQAPKRDIDLHLGKAEAARYLLDDLQTGDLSVQLRDRIGVQDGRIVAAKATSVEEDIHGWLMLIALDALGDALHDARQALAGLDSGRT